uniref:Uncharacterized protein n=1 Tax=Arundo donax TaxID=35708 RepID=A0A0A9HLW8_ARUDO
MRVPVEFALQCIIYIWEKSIYSLNVSRELFTPFSLNILLPVPKNEIK